MSFHRPTIGDFALAAGYFVLAALAVALTRFNGGVAIMWLGSALLIPALAYRPREKWATLVLLCGAASAAATGLFGLGWPMALPFVVINMTEACLGAALLARASGDQTPLGSLGWLGRFVAVVGLAAPAAAAVLAAIALGLLGLPFARTLVDFFAGHALGNLTFVPVFSLLMSGSMSELLRGFSRSQAIETASLLLLVAVVTAITFSIESAPLLFLPCGPIALAIFRGGQIGAVMSIVIVALIGGSFTIAGDGPLQLLDAPYANRIQFLQFYLASIVLTVLPMTADLRNRARLYQAMRFSEQRYRMLTDHSGDIIMHLDLEGRIRFVSPSIRLIGHEPDEMVGRPAADFVAAGDAAAVRVFHAETIAARGGTCRFDYRGTLRDGSERWFESLSRAIVDTRGEVDAVLSVIRDVSDRKRTEEAMAEAAMTDALTGLPNRRAFWTAAERLHACGREAATGCIALLDLDHFKDVNDVHGHDGGDSVLRQFAVQAGQWVREGDLIARIGGEEFALLLPRAEITDAALICDRVRRGVAAMGVPSAKGMIRVTVSGGVAELGPDGLDAALKRADLALYEAKAGGRDQLCLAA